MFLVAKPRMLWWVGGLTDVASSSDGWDELCELKAGWKEESVVHLLGHTLDAEVPGGVVEFPQNSVGKGLRNTKLPLEVHPLLMELDSLGPRGGRVLGVIPHA